MWADWTAAIAASLEDRRDHNILRQRRAVRPIDATHIDLDSKRLVNFASNDYLGLSHHPRVIAAFRKTAQEYGVGSGAAALVSGQTPVHAEAEKKLAEWKGTESTVLLGSGYTANLAAVQMLSAVSGGTRFLVDKLAHASLIDAVRSAGPNFRIFPHNHLPKLRRLLEDADPNVPQVVVTESIFSMDGDAADLAGIAALKKEFPFLLLLDEAHGSGVYGRNGAGYATEVGLADAVDLTVVTLSKAMGCVGGAICGSASVCDAVVNFGRPYVFSTAIPPAVAGGVVAAIAVMQEEPQRQTRVRELAARVRSGVLGEAGDSPIVPIVLGEESTALNSAEQLKEMGIFTVAVRPPTVPRGSSRLRVTLSCEHSDDEVDRLIAALIAFRP